MKIQLTILGLGQIGTSVGMALEEYKDQILRVGYDKSQEVVNLAKGKFALDKSSLTQSGAVKRADIIVLALPFQEIYPVLEAIAQDIKDNALVLDMGPLKGPVLKWAEELLPENRHFVGLTPVINSQYLEEMYYGIETARKDLFERCFMGVVSQSDTDGKAVNKAVNLVELLGATPYFSDPVEIDGLMTMTHIMPQVLASALCKISLDAPGWQEARKVAGKHYTQVSNPLTQQDAPGALAASLIHNQENTTRLLDDLIHTLVEIRDQKDAQGQTALTDMFNKLQEQRLLWWEERQKSRWIGAETIEIPKRSMLKGLLGIG
jgi:prephenate dehydrogenase